MTGEIDFKTPLQKIKDEVDNLDLKIVGCADVMHTLKEHVTHYQEMREQRKKLLKEKKEKVMTLKIIASFYEEVTGEKADAMYPLFNQ